MAQEAGADIQHCVWSAGAPYEKGKFTIGAIEYYCADVINIAYAQTGFEIPLSDDVRLKLAAQYTDEGSVGDNLLDGESFSGHKIGFKVELPITKAMFTAG